MPIVIETEEELAQLLENAEKHHAADADPDAPVPWWVWYSEWIFDEYGD